MKSFSKGLVVILLTGAAVGLAWASGGNRTGTAGAPELLIPVGTRDLAMGGASISNTRGIDALFWNPAGITRADNSANLIFSHMSYIADIGVEYGAASVNFDPVGTVALSIKSLSIGDIPVTTTESPDGTGQTYSPQFFVAGLSFARELSDRIAVGLTANLVEERLSQVSSSGFAFNIGIMYENLANLTGLSLGVVVNNIGPQMQYGGPGLELQANATNQLRGTQYYLVDAQPFEMPSTIQIGLGYKTPVGGENNALLVSTTFDNNNFSDDEYKVGAEYGYNNTFFVRGGYDFAPNATSNTYIYGATVGAGVQIQSEDVNIAVDYAYQDAKFFSGNNVISVRLGF